MITISFWLGLNFIVVPLLGLLITRRRRAAERARRRLRTDGYAPLLLGRLVVQTCRLVSVRKACVLVDHPGDPGWLIVVAARGLHEAVIGERVRFEATHGPSLMGATGFAVSAPGVVLFVATDDDPMRRFEPSEVELLRHLASLAAEAVEDLSIKAQLDSAIYARATELAAVRQFESGLLARPPVDEGELARAVGSRLGLDPGALVELEIAARVSEPGIVDKAGVRGDVGAVGSHDRSTEPLLRADPVAAADRLAGLAGFEGVALVVRFAGERWDARGRQGLPGPRIPLASRILAACDALRVLTSIRPWGRGATVEGALRGIQAASGKVFDPAVIAALSSELIGELPDFGESNPTANWAKADAQYSEVL